MDDAGLSLFGLRYIVGKLEIWNNTSHEEHAVKNNERGLQMIELSGLHPESSPWAGVKAYQGGPVSVPLDTPLGPQGTVMAWIRIDEPIINGPGVETDGGTILELPGVGRLNLWWYSGYGGVVWEFPHNPRLGSVELPGLPGPQWLHVCYTWDAPNGRFQGYINGTPIKIPGTKNKAWQSQAAAELKVDASRWAVAGVALADHWIEREDALAAVPSIYRGALDHTLGAQALGTVEADDWRGDLVFENPLGSPEDIEGWRMEGPGEVEFHDGWMRMWSTTPDAPGNEGHLVHWCPEDHPADFLLEFDVRILSDNGLNIIFFCAKGRGGEDALDPNLSERTGIFGHYTMGDLNCYHTSYYAGPGRTTTNMRKNHGFYLVDNGPIGIQSGDHDIHHVGLLKKGGTIRVTVDGRCVMDWHDDGRQYGPVLGAGKLALRQMKLTTAEYQNLRVSRLSK